MSLIYEIFSDGPLSPNQNPGAALVHFISIHISTVICTLSQKNQTLLLFQNSGKITGWAENNTTGARPHSRSRRLKSRESFSVFMQITYTYSCKLLSYLLESWKEVLRWINQNFETWWFKQSRKQTHFRLCFLINALWQNNQFLWN